jgi:hypothetical protein
MRSARRGASYVFLDHAPIHIDRMSVDILDDSRQREIEATHSIELPENGENSGTGGAAASYILTMLR